jgi:spore coat polysaccharide biosynthesis protein SpsF (cytidylyltransferase family)
MKATAIIQARVGSTRLPGKVLLKIMGKTILEYGLERVKKAKMIDKIIVATTKKEEDLSIVNLMHKLKVNVYRGSEDDVLDRYYQAAKIFKAKHIARITSDNPLIDPQIIDKIVKRYFESSADYCSNTLEETFPDGEDVEVFKFSALREAWKKAKLPSEREHVTPYLKKHPEKFKIVNVKNKKNLSDKRWTVDGKKDFELIKAILKALYPKNPSFLMKDILKFLKTNPRLEDLNKYVTRNTGYLKSLRKDQKIKSFLEEK